MKPSLVVSLLIAACLAAYGQQPMPRMTAVEPGNGKAGDVITVSGENLVKANVAKVYLTVEDKDVPVEIVEQAEKSIKFKIPAKVKAGRFALSVLTTEKVPKLIEQPVKVQIDE